MKRSCGFTIIELLVAISVMAILASLAIPSYLDFFEKSRLRGATEAVYEQLQHARSLSIKKSTPIIVDFWVKTGDATQWALGITDKNKDDGCDATKLLVTDASACVIEYDNDIDTDYDGDGVKTDHVLMRMASTNFTNITMTAPVFGTTVGPGACATKKPNEACFEPVQGFARSTTTTGHIQLKSSNNTYTLQVEIDATGRVKICVPSGKFIGYDGC